MKRMRAIPAVGLALLIACGGGAKTNGAGAVVSSGVIKAAFQKAVAAKSARLAMTMKIGGGDATGTITGSGVMSLAEARGVFFLDFGDIPGSPFSGRIEERFVNNIIYMKLAGLGSASKPWLKIDLKALSKLSGIDFSQLSQLQQQDPGSMLRYLEGVSGSVRRLGTERVRGVETTRYSATIDMQKALEKLPEGARASMQKVFNRAGISSVPVQVWISGDGLLRKMTMSMDLSKMAGAAQSGAADVAIELYDYGVPVSVSAPPANRATDFADYLRNR